MYAHLYKRICKSDNHLGIFVYNGWESIFSRDLVNM